MCRERLPIAKKTTATAKDTTRVCKENKVITFVGWIPGMPWHRKKLRQLGVQGRMKWRAMCTQYGKGVFEYCDASLAVMWRLVHIWKIPNLGSFTAIDENEKHLPLKKQIYWHDMIERSQQMLFLPREGQSLVEYALILVLVAIVVIAVLMILGPTIGNVFSKIVLSI